MIPHVRSLFTRHDLPAKGGRRLLIRTGENMLKTLGPLAALRRSKPAVLFYHHGRCGSTVLADTLAQHPGLWSDGEVFYREWKNSAAAGEVQCQPVGRWARSAYPRESFLAYLQGRSLLSTGGRRYLFEVKPQDFWHLRLTPEEFVTAFESAFQPGYILLFRKNWLKKILSSKIASATGRWHVRGSGEKVKMSTYRFPLEAVNVDGRERPLIEHFQRYEAEEAEIRRVLGNRRVLSLTFEDDVQSNPAGACKKIVEFLGLPPFEPQIEHRRTNAFPLREQIENFDEVAGLLQGTPYAWMLAEE